MVPLIQNPDSLRERVKLLATNDQGGIAHPLSAHSGFYVVLSCLTCAVTVLRFGTD